MDDAIRRDCTEFCEFLCDFVPCASQIVFHFSFYTIAVIAVVVISYFSYGRCLKFCLIVLTCVSTLCRGFVFALFICRFDVLFSSFVSKVYNLKIWAKHTRKIVKHKISNKISEKHTHTESNDECRSCMTHNAKQSGTTLALSIVCVYVWVSWNH